MSTEIITAESVCEGHPDKLCDLIADGILDACLTKDSFSRVACEVLATKGEITIAGEITCNGKIDYKNVAQKVLANVGYNPKEYKVRVKVHQQSADIDGGVSKKNNDIGAGDQGVVYGYACNDTEELLPLPVVLANKITKGLDMARHYKKIEGIKPDGKCLVAVEYINGIPKRVKSVVISVQHDESVSLASLKTQIDDYILCEVFSVFPIDTDTQVLINPSGRFVIGGPDADTGLTGRKLMCDTYGGIAHHGGGAFSGKDATKVDRSGAYMARYVAKNIVAARLAKKCEVSISYAIGKEQPIDVSINTFGTCVLSNECLKDIVMKVFDFTPKGIINQLKLRKPLFTITTCYCHFMHPDMEYEQVNKTSTLAQEAMCVSKYPFWR